MTNRLVDEDLDWLEETDPEKEKADMAFAKKEQIRIKLRAKRALGEMQKASSGSRRIFMENCIDQMTSDDPELDDSDARDVCEQLWEDGDTSDYEE